MQSKILLRNYYCHMYCSWYLFHKRRGNSDTVSICTCTNLLFFPLKVHKLRPAYYIYIVNWISFLNTSTKLWSNFTLYVHCRSIFYFSIRLICFHFRIEFFSAMKDFSKKWRSYSGKADQTKWEKYIFDEKYTGLLNKILTKDCSKQCISFCCELLLVYLGLFSNC